jgi:hypothetical protein
LFNPDIDHFFMDGEWIIDGEVKEAKCVAIMDLMIRDFEVVTMFREFENLELLFVVCVEERVQKLPGGNKRCVKFELLHQVHPWNLSEQCE